MNEQNENLRRVSEHAKLGLELANILCSIAEKLKSGDPQLITPADFNLYSNLIARKYNQIGSSHKVDGLDELIENYKKNAERYDKGP